MTSQMTRNHPLGCCFVLAALAFVTATFTGAQEKPQVPPAANVPARQIQGIVDSQYPELEQLYTALHRNPELSLAEAKTAKRLADELRKAGYAVTENVGGHGVVAVLENGPGQVLMIRTDL